MESSAFVAQIGSPAISPNGKFILELEADKESSIPYQSFNILSKSSGEIVFECEDWFDDRHTTRFLWDDSNRVWVYSGDIGTHFWVESDNGWTKHQWAGSGVDAPAYLKEFRPKIFAQ